MTDDEFSHVAFSDESRHNVGRYRAVAVLTCAKQQAAELGVKAEAVIREGGLREFKWYKLRQARDRFVALDLVELSLDAIASGQIRIDALIWDTHDSRHLIMNRDDIANLQRMYYHLLRNVMRLRWQSDAVWALYPDEYSSMDWENLAQILQYKSYSVTQTPRDLFSSPSGFALTFRRDFGIHAIIPVQSHLEPLCQVADLFAGIAAYSYSAFERYTAWQQQHQAQLSLLFGSPSVSVFSNSERDRFLVLKQLSDSCKALTLGVSLNSSSGLRTYKPTNPLNFWMYVPQTDLDKAPTKESTSS